MDNNIIPKIQNLDIYGRYKTPSDIVSKNPSSGTGGSAIGIVFKNSEETTIGGIGSLLTNGVFNYLYFGVGANFYTREKSLAIYENEIKWKNYDLVTNEYVDTIYFRIKTFWSTNMSGIDYVKDIWNELNTGVTIGYVPKSASYHETVIIQKTDNSYGAVFCFSYEYLPLYYRLYNGTWTGYETTWNVLK